MKILRGLAGFAFLLITLPIWLYLLYKILVLVQATELMWFLYWIYLPVSCIATWVLKCTENEMGKS